MNIMHEKIEKKLLDQMLKNETKKSWSSWCDWLKSQNHSFQPKKPDYLSMNTLVNYQTFIKLSESQLDFNQDWIDKLTAPSWILRNGIKLVPQNLINNLSNDYSYINSLKKELSDLIKNFNELLTKIDSNHENYAYFKKFSENFIKPKENTISLLNRNDNSGHANKDFDEFYSNEIDETKKNINNNNKEYEIIDLKTVYLSYNSWIDLFELKDFFLEKLFKKKLKIKGSHTISYIQFQRRLYKVIKNNEKTQRIFKEFEDKCLDGIEIKMQRNEIKIKNKKMKFELPNENEYKNFSDWIDWLDKSGLDFSELSSEDLKKIKSHEISFQQFCKRLEKKIKNHNKFRDFLNIN